MQLEFIHGNCLFHAMYDQYDIKPLPWLYLEQSSTTSCTAYGDPRLFMHFKCHNF